MLYQYCNPNYTTWRDHYGFGCDYYGAEACNIDQSLIFNRYSGYCRRINRYRVNRYAFLITFVIIFSVALDF